MWKFAFGWGVAILAWLLLFDADNSSLSLTVLALLLMGITVRSGYLLARTKAPSSKRFFLRHGALQMAIFCGAFFVAWLLVIGGTAHGSGRQNYDVPFVVLLIVLPINVTAMTGALVRAAKGRAANRSNDDSAE